MTRPKIAPDVAAALTAQIASRLLKKLDAEPQLAAGWAWTATTITTDKGEVVTLAISGDAVRGVSCSCLLQPKCLHVAAVVALLEPAELTAAPEAERVAVVATEIEVHAQAPATATLALRVLADVLRAGARAALGPRAPRGSPRVLARYAHRGSPRGARRRARAWRRRPDGGAARHRAP